ncbi:MAG: hypothetical protein WDN45_18875 [Caulobacteraceae bacterium]
MSQVENYLSNSPFSEFNLTAGKVQTEQTSTVGIPNGTYQTYTTGVIATGDESQPLSVFQGDVQFNINVASKYATTTVTNPDGTKTTVPASPPVNVPIDLTGMGSTPRTIDNVVNYINNQLKAAKVTTRFAAANLGSTASTTTYPNGQTATVKGTSQWGLTINGSSTETVSFSASSTAAAVYVSSKTGGAQSFHGSSVDPITGLASAGGQSATATGEQLMKLQTGNDVSGTAPPTISNAGSTTTGLPLGGVFAKNLPDGVSGVAASATAADGSVYLLANATGSVNSAPVQGASGVVLLKYDSSGKLLTSKMVPACRPPAAPRSPSARTDGRGRRHQHHHRHHRLQRLDHSRFDLGLRPSLRQYRRGHLEPDRAGPGRDLGRHRRGGRFGRFGLPQRHDHRLGRQPDHPGRPGRVHPGFRQDRRRHLHQAVRLARDQHLGRAGLRRLQQHPLHGRPGGLPDRGAQLRPEHHRQRQEEHHHGHGRRHPRPRLRQQPGGHRPVGQPGGDRRHGGRRDDQGRGRDPGLCRPVGRLPRLDRFQSLAQFRRHRRLPRQVGRDHGGHRHDRRRRPGLSDRHLGQRSLQPRGGRGHRRLRIGRRHHHRRAHLFQQVRRGQRPGRAQFDHRGHRRLLDP